MFSIIGNGHWGTAIAHYLSKHYPVEIIGRRQKKLPGDLKISQKTTLNDASYDHWIYAAPMQMATYILKPVLKTKQPESCLIASKGLIQNDAGQVMGLPDFMCSYMDRVAMISGPSFASELMNDMPTFLVGATHNNALAKDMSQWFNHAPIHLTLSRDVLGVSFSGAFKNPIAILLGYIDSLYASANMRFALITYVNQVMSDLLSAMDADPKTAYTAAGQGDLFMTCSIDESRNRQMGQLLAKGYTVEDAEKKIGSMVEGIASLSKLIQLCQQKQMYVPLFDLINEVLTGRMSKLHVLDRLMDLMQQPAIKILQSLDA